ncbi:MAG: hypothetical protein ACOY40_05940, partial [Bacillota bacterium]
MRRRIIYVKSYSSCSIFGYYYNITTFIFNQSGTITSLRQDLVGRTPSFFYSYLEIAEERKLWGRGPGFNPATGPAAE